ncbi:MAG: AAA family ATPase [Bacteroidales bacterium]|jgi:predicted ATPase
MSYLRGFGVENFRVFKKMTNFEFAPITFLTGPISSGKSSLIKAMLLLKLNWFKREYNTPYKIDSQFEDINVSSLANASNKERRSDFLRFSLPLSTKNFVKPITTVLEYDTSTGIGVLQEGSPFFKIGNRTLHWLTYNFDLVFDFELLKRNILPDPPRFYDNELITPKRILSDSSVFTNFFNLPDPYWGMDSPYESLLDAKSFISKMNIRDYLLSQDYDEEDVTIKLDIMYNCKEALGITEDKYQEIFKINGLPNYYYELHREFIDTYDDIFKNIHFLQPMRGLQKRVFNSSDNSPLNDILKSLTRTKPQNFVQEFINYWVKEFNLGNTLKIKSNERLDVNYILTDNNQSLVDKGAGATQIAAIILMIAKIANQNNGVHYKLKLESAIPSILILEQPEASLHPAFQSKLAELIYDAATKFNIQFIIETHSEYLIRKIQYLTAKGDMTPRDSIIYYFDKHDSTGQPKGELQIKKIKILDDGSLSEELGPGFFDEEYSLALGLVNIRRSQKN